MRVLRLVPVLAAFWIAAGAPARAIAIWPSMPGFWAGFGQSNMLPAVQGQADIEITAQARGLFRAIALLPAVQAPGSEGGATRYLCDGSVQPNPVLVNPGPVNGNVVNLFGMSTDGGRILLMHGKTRALGDGSVRIAALQYAVFNLLGNLLDGGIIAVLQRFGGLGWANPGSINVDGSYSGMYTVGDGPGGGCLMGSLASIMAGDPAAGQHATSGFQGNLEFEDDTAQFDLNFDILGTVGLPAVQRDGSTKAPIAMLGMDEHGIIAVLIGLLLPAVQTPGVEAAPTTISGQYALLGNLRALYAAVWRGSDTSFQMGTFQLPAVQ